MLKCSKVFGLVLCGIASLGLVGCFTSAPLRTGHEADIVIALPQEDFPRVIAELREAVRESDGMPLRQTLSSLQFWVPAERFEEFHERVSDLGEVVHEEILWPTAADEYARLRARLAQERQQVENYEKLLGEAEDVEERAQIGGKIATHSARARDVETRLNFADAAAKRAKWKVALEPQKRPGPLGWPFYLLYHGLKWSFVWD